MLGILYTLKKRLNPLDWGILDCHRLLILYTQNKSYLPWDCGDATWFWCGLLLMSELDKEVTFWLFGSPLRICWGFWYCELNSIPCALSILDCHRLVILYTHKIRVIPLGWGILDCHMLVILYTHKIRVIPLGWGILDCHRLVILYTQSIELFPLG
jgi:hypothetical protein